jgi:hypothetical protein
MANGLKQQTRDGIAFKVVKESLTGKRRTSKRRGDWMAREEARVKCALFALRGDQRGR